MKFQFSNKLFIGLGIAAGVVLYLMSKKSTAKNLKVLLSNVDFAKQKGLNLPRLILQFRLINPTNQQLTLNALTGDLYINEKLYSTINSLQETTIPANSELMYNVNVDTPIIQSLTSLILFFKERLRNKKAGKPQDKLNVQFKGNVNSGGIIIPISQTLYSNE